MEGVLISHAQHLVVVEALVEADETKTVVERIFVRLQEPRALQLFVVLAGLEAESLQCGRGAYEATHVGIGEHARVQTVRRVVRPVAKRIHDEGLQLGAHEGTVLAQIGECHYVSVLLVIAAGVGNPHFDAADLHAAVHRGQCAQGVLILLAEEVTEEVVLVRLVLIGFYVEAVRLRAARYLHVAPLSFLLAEEHRGR